MHWKKGWGKNLDEKSIIKVVYVPAVLHASVRTLSMQYWNTRLHTFDGRQLYWYFLALFTIQYCLFMVDCQVIFNQSLCLNVKLLKIFWGRWWHLMQLFYFVLVKYMCISRLSQSLSFCISQSALHNIEIFFIYFFKFCSWCLFSEIQCCVIHH